MDKPRADLRRVLLRIANRAAMGAAYAKWPDDFCRSEVREVWLAEPEALFTTAELAAKGRDYLDSIGFGRWDEEGDLYLIPIWAWNYVADGETLTSISGDTKVKGGPDEIDLDVRFGCIAWGFSVPETEVAQ
jgi:hypothetical protein